MIQKTVIKQEKISKSFSHNKLIVERNFLNRSIIAIPTERNI